MKNLKIQKSTGIQLNGNKITGNTYPVKDYIKAYLGGKWDGNTKSWIVDLDKVSDLLDKTSNFMEDNSKQTTETHNHNGICPKCHTYCYGDCSTN